MPNLWQDCTHLFFDVVMTAIERTAYPRFPQRALLIPELEACYTPTEEELQFVLQYVRNKNAMDSNAMQYQLNMLVLLKCFQQLGYFPKLKGIPDSIIQHISHKLGLPLSMAITYTHSKMLYRHQQAIRQYLKVQSYQKTARRLAIQAALGSAHLHNYPADIINNVIEGLVKAKYELPAFIQLDRLVRHVRYRANQQLFAEISQAIPNNLKQRLDETLTKATRTEYHRLKQLPKSATLSHFKDLLTHHDWLLTFGSMLPFLESLSQIKRQHFAGEAKALDAGHIREMNPAKRYTLMACLIHEMQLQAKDNLVLMLIKTLAKIHKRAKLKLSQMREQQEKKTQAMLGLLNDIVLAVTETKTLESVEDKLKQHGGAEHVQADCETLLACHSDNHLPLLWQHFKSARPTLIKLLRLLSIQSANQDDNLIQAMQHMLAHAHLKRELIPADCTIDFASKAWKKLILKKENNQQYLVKRHFEACVFSCLTDELHSTNIWVKGSASYPDFREHLLPWIQCEPLVNDYCQNLQLPMTGSEALKQLRDQLAKKAKQIDKQFPDIAELGLSDKGEPILKRRKREEPEPELRKLSQAIKSRMPERNLIDILTNMQHYTGWANFFGPLSGNESKLANATERYILTTFAYGTGMGPTQAAQHMKNQITAHMLSWINCQHVTAKQQDQAMTSLIDYYALFELAQHWGKGEAAAADGKLRKIYEENLIAEMHIRYGSKGGIAYHHIADNYIALFSTFIPCGVWEAVQIIEGLLKNQSVIQPKIIHGDTQAGSVANSQLGCKELEIAFLWAQLGR